MPSCSSSTTTATTRRFHRVLLPALAPRVAGGDAGTAADRWTPPRDQKDGEEVLFNDGGAVCVFVGAYQE